MNSFDTDMDELYPKKDENKSIPIHPHISRKREKSLRLLKSFNLVVDKLF
jgi:hypothetical protein